MAAALLLLLLAIAAKDVLAQLQLQPLGVQKLIKEVQDAGPAILGASRMPGVQVRLCNCEEQAHCVEEMERQTKMCSQQCWSAFSSISTNPRMLFECLQQQEDLPGNMIVCMTTNIRSCSNFGEELIQKVNIAKLLNLVQKKIEENKYRILEDPTVRQMQGVANALFEYGGCVKNCFIQLNRQEGACFDKLDCQPRVDEGSFSSSTSTCIRQSQAQMTARVRPICQCAMQSGVTDSQKVCPAVEIAAGARDALTGALMGGGGGGGGGLIGALLSGGR